MTSHSHKPPWSVVLGLVALFVSGIALLIVLSLLKFDGRDVAWEFGRELGIALVVSGVVASLFELYRSIRHHIQTMRDVIDLTLGEQITPEVWLELKELIETRRVIRRNVHLRWTLARNASLGANEAIFGLEHEYELHALSSRKSSFTIEHELDYHMSQKELCLPRFERIVIDPPGADALVFEGDGLDENCKGGKLSVKVELQPRGGDPVRIRVERYELVNVPGSYNLYTPEFTKGLQLHYGDCPVDVEPEVLVRPSGQGLLLKHVGNNWSCEHLLLPGQGVEIKFRTKSSRVLGRNGPVAGSEVLFEATAQNETSGS